VIMKQIHPVHGSSVVPFSILVASSGLVCK
jgi:hypothetical protein